MPLELTLSWQSPTRSGSQTLAVQYHCDPDGTRLRACIDSGQWVPLDRPVRLASIAIDKPWGQEIWFTGMEARGEASIEVDGATLPLSAYLALAPGWSHQGENIVLLKILDPRPEAVTGDLYFEVHERKEETYVVTAIAREAWPDGTGAIRYGVNQALRTQYGNDEAFRRDYLQAVQRYERVRRLLDGEAPAQVDAELNTTDPAMLAGLEAQRRADMEQFTSVVPLKIGDIVLVPPWHPHSLQHGVQVVEFQSPTYERFIISFAQQVQTQPHWDSATAIARMSLEPLAPEPPIDPELPQHQRRIADYQDFGALRVALSAACEHYRVPAHLPYAVVICVEGHLACGSLTLQPGEAAFLPGIALRAELELHSCDSLFLIAAPRL